MMDDVAVRSLVFSDSPTVFVKLHYYRKIGPSVFSQEFFYCLLGGVPISRIYLVKQVYSDIIVYE